MRQPEKISTKGMPNSEDDKHRQKHRKQNKSDKTRSKSQAQNQNAKMVEKEMLNAQNLVRRTEGAGSIQQKGGSRMPTKFPKPACFVESRLFVLDPQETRAASLFPPWSTSRTLAI